MMMREGLYGRALMENDGDVETRGNEDKESKKAKTAAAAAAAAGSDCGAENKPLQ